MSIPDSLRGTPLGWIVVVGAWFVSGITRLLESAPALAQTATSLNVTSVAAGIVAICGAVVLGGKQLLGLWAEYRAKRDELYKGSMQESIDYLTKRVEDLNAKGHQAANDLAAERLKHQVEVESLKALHAETKEQSDAYRDLVQDLRIELERIRRQSSKIAKAVEADSDSEVSQAPDPERPDERPPIA